MTTTTYRQRSPSEIEWDDMSSNIYTHSSNQHHLAYSPGLHFHLMYDDMVINFNRRRRQAQFRNLELSRLKLEYKCDKCIESTTTTTDKEKEKEKEKIEKIGIIEWVTMSCINCGFTHTIKMDY
jgi:hypothetical protein